MQSEHELIFHTTNLETLQSAGYIEQLVAYINDLVLNDFNKLLQLLYRIDIDENKLKTNLSRQEGRPAAVIIAEMIITRQTEKIISRKNYKQEDTEDNDERW